MTTNTVQTATATTHTSRVPIDTLANRLMLARAQAGHISIREAADRCQVGRGAWTNWEKGAQPERIDELVDLIAERLDCDRHWLRHGGVLRPAEVIESRKPRWQRGQTTLYAHRPAREALAPRLVDRGDDPHPAAPRPASHAVRATRRRHPHPAGV
jgi:hypothetical protein